MSRPRVTLVTLVAADLLAVVALVPNPAALRDGLASPHRWVATSGTDHVAAALARAGLWCVAVWLAVGLLAALIGALPGLAGRTADAIARVVLPRVLYRAVAGAAGLGVLLAPVAAGAAVPTAGSARGPAATAPAVPAPAWPTDGPVPAPAWPTDHAGQAPAAPATTPPPTPAANPRKATPEMTRTPDTTNPARPTPTTSSTGTSDSTAPSAPQSGSGSRSGDVVVRDGDSLWLIAARRIGLDATTDRIAAEWPRWYAANRAAIGADPDVIQPGQVLHAPETAS